MPPRPDPVKVHAKSYEYRMDDAMLNAPLVEHMRREHHEDWAAWDAGCTIGDIEDQHYIAHGLLTSEAELSAAYDADIAAEH